MELTPGQFKALRELLRNHFESDMSGWSHYETYISNIAMLLYDHYDLTISAANEAAMQIMCLVFGVGEKREE